MHPAVAEVAVVGLPDERWGQRIAAFIKRATTVEADALDAWCRQSSLAGFKRPRDYVFVAEIPKSPVGKILRRLLVAGGAMTDPAPLLPTLPDSFDGFHLAIDPARERADIVLDRPPLNVVTMAEREQLRAVFEVPDADDRVRVIVVRAEGEHFSSGGEIRGFLDASPEHVSRLAWNIAAPARCRKPVIIASRGYCFGVGFELALACDFRLASETCLYSLPEQRLGQIPGSGGAARLQKMVGITRTKDIVMRSRRIAGRQAYDWGIATECVADAELEAAADKLAKELRGFPPLAQRTAKKLLNDIEETSLALRIELEGQAYGRLRSSEDFREGVEAFHQKRKPNFRGR